MRHHVSASPATTPTADPAKAPAPPAGASAEGDRPIGYREVVALLRTPRRTSFDPSPADPRRACGQLLALLLIASGAALGALVYDYGQKAGVPWNSQAVHNMLVYGQLAVTMLVFCWLSRLVISRTRQTMSVAGRWGLRLGAVAVTIAAVAGAWPVGGAVPYPNAGDAAFAVAVAWLTLEVCRRHGITPVRLAVWPLRPGTEQDLVRGAGVGLMGFVACFIAATGSTALVPVVPWAGLSQATDGSQQDVLGIFSIGDVASGLLRMVVMEDLVMVAAVVALLSAARRPAWQMYATTCIAEVAVHAYFGLAALAILPYAWLRVWLYRRYGTIIPLIAAHLLYNSVVIYGWFFTEHIGQLFVLSWFAILLVAADWIKGRVAAHRNCRTSPVVTEGPETQ